MKKQEIVGWTIVVILFVSLLVISRLADLHTNII